MNLRMNKVKLAYIVTHPMTLRYKLMHQIEFLEQLGYEISVITAAGVELEQVKLPKSVAIHIVPFRREISLFHDISALFKTIVTLRRIRPTIVNASTPKAGLIGMIAAWLLRVPIRIYLLRGLRYETLVGAKLMLVRFLEQVSCRASTKVLAVSESLRKVAIKDNLVGSDKILVLGQGTSNGVDVAKFNPGEQKKQIRSRIHEELGLPASAQVVLFLGRLTRDKGIEDLVLAFEEISKVRSNAYLLLVGDFEKGDPVPKICMDAIDTHPKIKHISFASNPIAYLAACDVFAFPSYREGFPVAPLEAACAEVPTVAYAVTGSVDAVKNGSTGALVPFGDRTAFANAILAYLDDGPLRDQHGLNARQRVETAFDQEKVWTNIHEFYSEELKSISP